MRSVLILLVCLAAAASSCGPREESPRSAGGPPPVTVETTVVRREPIADVVALVGALTAEESVMIRAEADGVVDRIGFEEGQYVAAGTLLVHLRDGEERALLAEAEAQLELAKQEFERARTLASKRSLSESELDRARAQREVARARVERRRVELGKKAIHAPFDGVLGARLVSPGDRVDHEIDIVQIDAIDNLRLVFTLPEVAVGLARLGFPLELSVAPYPGDTFAGEIYFIAPTVDPQNRRLTVKALVPNADHRLRPGLFADIRARVAEHPDALVVPETAVTWDARGPFVWRVTADGTAERSGIEMGIRSGGRVEVLAGVAEGDRIVSAGTHKVLAGAPVTTAAATPGA